jgi:hypothetical protein
MCCIGKYADGNKQLGPLQESFREASKFGLRAVYAWALLAPERPDGHPRPDARSCSPFPASTHGPASARHCSSAPLSRSRVGARAAERHPRRPLASPPASHAYPMCNTRSTFQTFGCNTCNIQKRQMKRLKHASETHAKTLEKHTQHPDKTLTTYV